MESTRDELPDDLSAGAEPAEPNVNDNVESVTNDGEAAAAEETTPTPPLASEATVEPIEQPLDVNPGGSSSDAIVSPVEGETCARPPAS